MIATIFACLASGLLAVNGVVVGATTVGPQIVQRGRPSTISCVRERGIC